MNKVRELQAIVVSSDSAVLNSILTCLEEFGIDPSVHAQSASALQTLSREKIDACFVDQDLDPELSVLREMRVSPSSRGAVGFAVVSVRSSAAPARIADFMIDKPVELTSLSRAVRAAYGIMLKERRRYFRYSLQIPIDVTDCRHRQFIGHTVNLSQTGIAVECVASLAAHEIVQLEFRLPDTQDKVQCKAQIIWTAEKGKMGLTFVQMKPSHRERLTAWIEHQFHGLWHMPTQKSCDSDQCE